MEVASKLQSFVCRRHIFYIQYVGVLVSASPSMRGSRGCKGMGVKPESRYERMLCVCVCTPWLPIPRVPA